MCLLAKSHSLLKVTQSAYCRPWLSAMCGRHSAFAAHNLAKKCDAQTHLKLLSLLKDKSAS
ncbi:uncharacterized protein EpC_19510 [Erwinia pyrifoliae Ep1/96]|nr:uncharacterized protein EpC_19510 [Erwinia pyrifoliae Ep1/96]